MLLCCVDLPIVVFSGGALVLSLHAQNGPKSGQSTNLGQVEAEAPGAKTMFAKTAATQSQLTNSHGATIAPTANEFAAPVGTEVELY